MPRKKIDPVSEPEMESGMENTTLYEGENTGGVEDYAAGSDAGYTDPDTPDSSGTEPLFSQEQAETMDDSFPEIPDTLEDHPLDIQRSDEEELPQEPQPEGVPSAVGEDTDADLAWEREFGALGEGEAELPPDDVVPPELGLPSLDSRERETPAPALTLTPDTEPLVDDMPVEQDSALAPVKEKRPAAVRQTSNFYKTDFKRLDRDLTEPEQEEWNAIYASFRSGSILTGTVAGADQNELPVKNPESGRVELRTITSLVVINYRVKVLIPENEVWMRGEERGAFLLRNMAGATVDYVIISVDREGGCAIASRSKALTKRRRAFLGARNAPQPGDIVKGSALVVGPKRCLISYAGFDIPQHVTQMSYTPILDMRDEYHPGQEFRARLLGYDPTENRLRLSVKEASPHPFDGAERRHPVGSRRQATIQGKYAGGVFCAGRHRNRAYRPV